jgi:hypothetical protein
MGYAFFGLQQQQKQLREENTKRKFSTHREKLKER